MKLITGKKPSGDKKYFATYETYSYRVHFLENSQYLMFMVIN